MGKFVLKRKLKNVDDYEEQMTDDKEDSDEIKGMD